MYRARGSEVALLCIGLGVAAWLVLLAGRWDAPPPPSSTSAAQSAQPLRMLDAVQHLPLARDASARRAGVSRPDIRAAYVQLPLSFEPNQGQTDARVKFISRGNGYNLFLTSAGAVLRLRKRTALPRDAGIPEAAADFDADTPAASHSTVLLMRWEGSAGDASLTALAPLPGKSNYFLGNNPNKWRANIPTYAAVKYHDLYPGVDLVCYGSQRQLEFDFVLAPGADPDAIQLRYEGAHRTRIDAAGDLVLETPGGEIRQHRPVVYQDIAGNRRYVAGRYVLREDGAVGFELDGHDASRSLVIDPVLAYSSYLGGTGFESGNAIAVDSNGDAYVTGETDSTDFPTQDAFQPDLAGGSDIFLTKMDAAGTTLVYSTYLGGSRADRGNAIAVDDGGNVYLTGRTASLDFPVVNALLPTFRGGTYDAFVAKLNAQGNALLYSTYLGGGSGGTANDAGFGIAADPSGNVYVTGGTQSDDFPTSADAFQRNIGGSVDAFVTKLDTTQPDAASLVYSTYLGGAAVDRGQSIAIDAAGYAYVTGRTGSLDFPTRNPLQSSFAGGLYDAFVTVLNETGSDVLYSTYLGGNGLDEGNGIAVDSSGNIYVTGETGSTDFPTASAYQDTGGGGSDAFLVKFDATGALLLYSTYFGGSQDERSTGVALDPAGNVSIAGETSSTDFPTSNPLQTEIGGGKDAFVAKFDATQQGAASLLYSSYLGGSADDAALSIAVDSAGSAWITGQTASADFPTANALQEVYGGGATDAFVAKITDDGVSPRLLRGRLPALFVGSHACSTAAQGLRPPASE